MSTQTQQNQRTAVQPMSEGGAVAHFKPARLPYHPAIQERFGVDPAGWRALVEAVFPLASNVDSVVLALSYCRARNLDPFKKPVHIVPMWNSDLGRMVDTVWPGIGELRTTAFRTKLYAGCDAVEFGPDVTRVFKGRVGKRGQEREVEVEVTFPEWAQMTVYRMIAGQRVAVQGPRVYWMETYATSGRTSVPNDMWAKRPRGQIEKCAEAAALRRAFPEELGNEYAAEEMAGRKLGSGAVVIEDDSVQEVKEEPITAASIMAQAEEAPQQVEGEVLPPESIDQGEMFGVA